MSTSLKPQLTAEEIQETRQRFTRFHILVIGQANAGKTTILRAVCNTTDEPMIFNPDGKKVKYIVKVHGPMTFICVISDRVISSWSILDSKSFDVCVDIDYNILLLQRGEHNIENEMIFEGNPGFIFHNSRGFEAGGDWELKLIQQFIKQHSKAGNVNEQLHVIWCVDTCILLCPRLIRSKLLKDRPEMTRDLASAYVLCLCTLVVPNSQRDKERS